MSVDWISSDKNQMQMKTNSLVGPACASHTHTHTHQKKENNPFG